jgi:hypothetical protein
VNRVSPNGGSRVRILADDASVLTIATASLRSSPQSGSDLTASTGGTHLLPVNPLPDVRRVESD